MPIIIPEPAKPREPQWFDEPVPENVEALAKAIGDAMMHERGGRILLPWHCHPDRKEALAYARAAIEHLEK